MTDSSFLALIQNAALLLAMAVVFDTTAKQWRSTERWWRQVLLGLLLGIIGVVVMNTPWIYGEGLIFDTRSILLSISGLFFGSVPTLIAMVMTAVYRFSQGGAYVTGISVIIATSLIGILWRHLRKRSLVNLRWWELYLFGVLIHVVMLALMFTQPFSIALPLVSKISLPIMTIYPFGTLLLGMLLLNRLRREKAIEETEKSRGRLKSMVDILQYPTDATQSFFDFALEETLKLTESQIGFLFLYSEETGKFSPNSWSKSVLDVCSVPEPLHEYDLDKVGVWGEAVKKRQPLIINEFQKIHPLKKGFPEGHVPIEKLLVLPIFSDNQIVAVLGVANKAADYNEVDATQLALLMEMVWKTTERKEALGALKISEEKYRQLFDQAADGIFISSEDGALLDVNESGCAMLGYTQDEFKTGFAEILKNNQKVVELEKVSEKIISGQKVLNERELITKNGKKINVEILTQILPDGRVQRVIRNITERKKAEETVKQAQRELQSLLQISDDSRRALLSVIEDQKDIEEALRKSEQSYRNLFENITQGFALHRIILDEEGNPVDYEFLAVNPAYERLTGLTTQMTIGKTVKEVIPNIEQKWIDKYGKVALTLEPTHFEDYVSALGKYYEVTAFSPEKGFFAVVVSDISERKKYEQEIQEFNLKLENKVKARTAELELANRELESFSYSISHDLRAPLRSINGFSQIILEEHIKDLNDEVVRYFDLIRKNSAMMGDLVDDLLNFSRLGRQPLSKVKTDPAAIIKDVIESMQAEIAQRNIKVEVRKLPECKADPALLKQVFINLISNAIKFTRSKVDPKIEIGYMSNNQETGKTNCYYIEDNGVGFDMKFYDKLFGVFQRFHRAEEYEGTGVGLAIVERIVAKHGGKIWAESVVGRGTTFYFTLGETKHG